MDRPDADTQVQYADNPDTFFPAQDVDSFCHDDQFMDENIPDPAIPIQAKTIFKEDHSDGCGGFSESEIYAQLMELHNHGDIDGNSGTGELEIRIDGSLATGSFEVRKPNLQKFENRTSGNLEAVDIETENWNFDRVQAGQTMEPGMDGIGKPDTHGQNNNILRVQVYTVRQMEKTKKALYTRLSRLNDRVRKDDAVTFEQLGVDWLFVDESHNYKNCFLYTKMRNVVGIAQSEAQKSSDMFAKCQYMDELTGGRGITFATGTSIANSMTEMYVNMRYLQYSTLKRLGLGQFDAWASAFGETVTSVELAPEGTGYRAKTRFAKFFNLPELMSIFKECADIQTADMLKLPVPEVEYENVVLKPSSFQKEIVQSLAERAEKVRSGVVESWQDNMLKVTNDGRKLALDQRLVDSLLPDHESSKASECVERAYQIWEETKEQKSAQIIFCDLSTPKSIKKQRLRLTGKAWTQRFSRMSIRM